MNINDGFGEILETGKSTVRKTAKNTAQGAANFAKTAQGQISGNQGSSGDQGTNEQAATTQQQMSDDAAKQFLRDLYGAPDKNPNKSGKQNPSPQANKPQTQSIPQAPEYTQKETPPPKTSTTIKNAMGIFDTPANQKTPEETAKIEALRNQLHGAYYQDLTNRKKAPEEHVTEKLERKEQEEKMTELEVQKKKPPPIAVQRVQQSAEKFRGVSG